MDCFDGTALQTFEDKAFGSSICSGCLEGVPGSRPYEEKCNATLGDAETLFSAAAKYTTDWMALWTLNGIVLIVNDDFVVSFVIDVQVASLSDMGCRKRQSQYVDIW